MKGWGTILFGLLDYQELFSRHSAVLNEAILTVFNGISYVLFKQGFTIMLDIVLKDTIQTSITENQFLQYITKQIHIISALHLLEFRS